MKYCLCLLLLFSCSDTKKETIALLLPVSHPSFEKTELSFKKKVEEDYPGRYDFITYNAQGNRTLLRAEIEEIAGQNYASLVTFGSLASKMASEYFLKKGVQTPLIFTSVNDPSLIAITPFVTGVEELLNFKEEIEHLLKYKPTIRSVLLVYNPMDRGLVKNREEIEALLGEKNISLIALETFQNNELMAKVSSLIDQADALLVLKDNTVITGLDILVRLCNEYHVPLIASDLDSPDRGAAFGYGVNEEEFGIEAAKKLNKIGPITPVTNFAFKINKKAALLQGIKEELLP